MSSVSYKTLTQNGLWKNNPALVQLLGLCPLLAVSASVVNSLGLAAATLFVLTTSNLCVSLVRNVVSDTIRLPVFVMIIAAAVTAIELLMQAYTYELYQILGIFLPAQRPWASPMEMFRWPRNVECHSEAWLG